MTKRAQRQDVVAAIARREWLLQMLALGVAGCRRDVDAAYARGSTVVMAVPNAGVLDFHAWGFDFLTFLPLVRQNSQGDLEGAFARVYQEVSNAARAI